MKNIKNTTSQPKPIIYRYINYRDYLYDWYLFQKRITPRFSYRALAELVGVCSHNYLQRIIRGNRNLSLKYLKEFCQALSLTRPESRYFKLLLEYDTASAAEKKTNLFKRIMIMREKEGKELMQESQLLFFDRWYRPIVRELLTLFPFDGDYKKLGSRCIPRISENDAREAVNYLRDNGFIKIGENGTYIQTSPVISTGDEIQSHFVRKYHQETMGVVSNLIDTIPPQEREVSTLTFSVSKDTYRKMKEEIRSFRKRMIDLAQADENPEMVYTASFQLVPRSKREVT